MRSFYFRPQPVLTLISLIGLSILIALGVWQKKRLAWKTDLLASVDVAANAVPLTSLAEIEAAFIGDGFIEFRRVDIPAELVEMDAPFYVFTARNRDISWRRFQVAKSMGGYVFADIGSVTDEARRTAPLVSGPVSLIGYVRSNEWQEKPQSESSPDKNRWFGFNPLPETHDWASISGLPVDTRYYIETVPGIIAGEGLQPKQPDIANNHFEYMLTWFSLAILLIIFYVLIHIRDGRAGRRTAQDN